MSRPVRICPTLILFHLLGMISAGAVPREVAEIQALTRRVPGFAPVLLPQGPGVVELTTDQSLTIDRLRGKALDDHPPRMRSDPPVYPPKMTDDYPSGSAPYVARNIEPFRFRYFNNEFNYGGWHNYAMADYASLHGFNILYPYAHEPEDWPHVPAGTEWLRWSGFVNWHQWMPEHGVPDGRYDLLVGRDLVGELLDAGALAWKPGYSYLMIDMEHGVLSPEDLRKQVWYPRNADAAQREAFERRYYRGYAMTYIAPVQAARRAGWKNISLYGWQPFRRTYFGLGKQVADPASDWAWTRFGRSIYEAVDILNPSVYCFYWTPQNVAYVLANIDLNMRFVNSADARKPVRPYFWTLLHGGGAGWRWWKGQPLPDEDVRAMIALAFFTGIDGFDTWNWSGKGNHHRPALKPNSDVMVGTPFTCTVQGETGEQKRSLHRYDVLHVLEVTPEGVVRFQVIDKAKPPDYGVGEHYPVCRAPVDDLRPHLRPRSEPVAAMIEGMALVKPLEYILRHGKVCIDVSAQKQFAEKLPIVRRVQMGTIHVVATYDPLCVFGGAPRTIALNDFAGVEGRTLRLPADSETRIFVLQETGSDADGRS